MPTVDKCLFPISSLYGCKLLSTWLLSAGLIAVIFGQLNVPHMWKLAMRGKPAEGVVVSKEAENHRAVTYAYRVEERQYISKMQGAAGMGNPPFEKLAPGTRLNIYYDPNDPNVSIAGEPQSHLTNELISVGLATVLIPTFFVLMWNFQAGRFKNR